MLKAVLLDISGVLTEDGEALPGAVEAVARLASSGLRLRFLTNTSRKTSAAVCEELKRLGFDVAPEQVFTAPGAIRRHLERHRLRPYLLIHENLEPEFADLPGDAPNAVVLGDAEQRLDYAHLDEAFRLLLEGAPLIAVGTNRYFRENGTLHLDAGPFVRALEVAAGSEARILGKPSGDFFRAVLEEAGVEPGEALMVGDDVECDVLAAMEVGLEACLVRSGKYRQGDEARAPEARCEASLAALVEALLDAP
ncbi:TIGR01458 family HAD-type hydrolase [Halomonas saccharevitans]|uniref:Haloacid dehalogenase-like hydrolase domain-containing protein 2 n=1 Tax=Halomonas saccharevitans TaxID=416872 RepID=A0A1I7CX04_9GAMM|nr:TIGR01458 family HAD-type hydrolase [Halomonas saccharevitans]SFU03909.1 HAD-superfamily subfamily IIA hydrolase, TIGR01458 [Halomonas saccharevitans]